MVLEILITKINKMKSKIFIIWIFFLIPVMDTSSQEVNLTSETNFVTEWSYVANKIYDNPFYDVSLYAEIKDEDGNTINLPAFWSGDNEWRFRFSSPVAGKFSFKTICSNKEDKGLHGKRGTIQVNKYEGEHLLYKHGTIKLTEDKKHFEHLDGKPFFWLADSWWHGMTTRFKWPEDFHILTADRKEKGFSVIQFAIGFPCDIEPFDPRGQNEAGDPWDENMNSINPAYFDLTDLRINWLIGKELIPNIVGVWGYYMKFFGPEKMKKHWDYLIARYGAYPVTFTLCGEATLAWYDDLGSNWDKYKKEFRSEWSEVARHIQKNDPFDRLLTVHPGPGIHDGKPPINDMDAVDFVMLQSGHKGFHTIPTSYRFISDYTERFPDKPIMHGEVCFEGMHGSSLEDVQRFLFWSNILMGTAGFSYGVEGIWQFNTEEQLFGRSPGGNTWGNVPWEVAYKYKGSKHLGIGKKILDDYDYNRLEPHPEWITKHANHDNPHGAYCAGIPGELRVIYYTKAAKGFGDFSVLNLEKDVKYSYQFIDPITAKRYEKQPVRADESGRWKIPQEPISQDWVLVLEREN
jgi:hypothetical protein